MCKRRTSIVAFAIVLVVAGAAGTARAGSLEPPGPPAPTMKSLDLIEPGIAITSLPIVIDQPGRYYLTRSFEETNPLAYPFQVNSDDVTLDFMGFSVSFVGGGAPPVAIVLGPVHRITVKNGTLRGYAVAIYDSFFDPALCSDVLMEDFTVQSTTSSGLELPDRSVLRRVRVFEATLFGLHCHASCTVSDSVFSGNGLGITGETVFITQSQVTGNQGAGIDVGPSSVVRDNLVSGNSGNGIVARDRSLVVGNNVRGNGGHGIFLWALGENRVESNNVVSNTGFGIYVDTGGNFVVKNSGRGNGAGFLTTNGTTPNVAPVEIGTATNPWSNIQY